MKVEKAECYVYFYYKWTCSRKSFQATPDLIEKESGQLTAAAASLQSIRTLHSSLTEAEENLRMEIEFKEGQEEEEDDDDEGEEEATVEAIESPWLDWGQWLSGAIKIKR